MFAKRINFVIFQEDAEAVKAHRWFKGIDWEDVYACRIAVSEFLDIFGRNFWRFLCQV